MLNVRALSRFALQGASDEADAVPHRSVEAFETGEGVIVLSNRPMTADTQAVERADASAPLEPNAVAPLPASPSTARVPPGVPPSERHRGDTSTALWLGLGALMLLLAGAALLMRRRRRRSTARYTALLAGSAPVGTPHDVTPSVPPGQFAPVPATAATVEGRSMAPVKSAEERSSPRSAPPPPSGVSAPPTSERQWLSQPPPRNVKDPPD